MVARHLVAEFRCDSATGPIVAAFQGNIATLSHRVGVATWQCGMVTPWQRRTATLPLCCIVAVLRCDGVVYPGQCHVWGALELGDVPLPGHVLVLRHRSGDLGETSTRYYPPGSAGEGALAGRVCGRGGLARETGHADRSHSARSLARGRRKARSAGGPSDWPGSLIWLQAAGEWRPWTRKDAVSGCPSNSRAVSTSGPGCPAAPAGPRSLPRPSQPAQGSGRPTGQYPSRCSPHPALICAVRMAGHPGSASTGPMAGPGHWAGPAPGAGGRGGINPRPGPQPAASCRRRRPARRRLPAAVTAATGLRRGRRSERPHLAVRDSVIWMSVRWSGRGSRRMRPGQAARSFWAIPAGK